MDNDKEEYSVAQKARIQKIIQKLKKLLTMKIEEVLISQDTQCSNLLVRHLLFMTKNHIDL